MEMDYELAGELPEGGEAAVGLLGHDRGKQTLAPDLHDVGHLGREHVIGAAGLGLADELDRGIEIGGRIETRAHLHQTDRERRRYAGSSAHEAGLSGAGAAGGSPSSVTSSGSSLPAR